MKILEEPKTKHIPYSLTVYGDGSSIWDSKVSKNSFNIRNAEMHYDGFYSKGCGSLTVFGGDLLRDAYTDELIEKQVGEAYAGFLPSKESKVVWSEYGMQRDGAWNFDIVVPRKK